MFAHVLELTENFVVNCINEVDVSVKFTASLIVRSYKASFPIVDVSHPQLVLERSETKTCLEVELNMSCWLPTLFLAPHRWPVPCLPPDDGPHWDDLCGLGDLGGLGGPGDLGGGKDGGRQHDGCQVDPVAVAGQSGPPAGSPHQCCLAASLQNEKYKYKAKKCEEKGDAAPPPLVQSLTKKDGAVIDRVAKWQRYIRV